MDRHTEMTHEELLKVLELELKKLHTKDKRKAMLYWHYLNKKISPMNLTIDVQPVSPEETSIQIENIIRNYRGNVQNKIDIIKYIELSFSQSFLEEQQLNWIDKKDSRLIYFLFLFFKKHPSYNSIKMHVNISSPANYAEDNCSINVFSFSGMQPNPRNDNEIYDNTIKYIDLIPIPKENKLEIINQIIMMWDYTFQSNNLSWLDKNNPEQCHWAWKYISSYNPKIKESQEVLSTSCIYIQPTSDKQYYNYSIAAFDTWISSPETKYIFIQAIKKAWNQKKHRDKLGDKKPYSFNLSSATKKQLDEISNLLEKHKNEILEELINTKHQQVKTK